ncbi:Protein CBG16972 [Caenorhabditis briggsae]|uniref:Protein CBG16972 n=1 Tax=Caenorhabditis briggsae TaxID=6238 RepID=A8XQ61_CAEBR|nr:Protein CBG16972 [Caenorhabditis briggsae]CAP34787.2 Protein CBG16972 [Caenorhabditis briggsae]
MPRTTHKEVRPFHGMGSNDTSSQERRVGEDDVPYAVKEMATLEDTSNVDFEMELEDMDKDEDTDEDDGGQTGIMLELRDSLSWFRFEQNDRRSFDARIVKSFLQIQNLSESQTYSSLIPAHSRVIFVYLHSNYENIENLRNGSDKTHHLRLTLALTALVSDSMKPKARLVLIALGFLTNKMYSNTQAPTLFDIQLSAAAAWYLAEANKEYITMKTHRKHARGTDYTRGNLYTATVNQKWSPIGFAATQLYDMETGSAFDRETCERNIEKMIKNDRDIDYMEWLNLASKCREEGKDLLEKFSLGMATQTALVDNADELLVCYGSSQKANKYVPVNPSIFTKMSDYIIAGFGQTNSQDRKTQVISYLQSSLENKLNRVRARYNAKFGKSQSEQAAIWLHDELMQGEASELKSHPLNFNSSNVSGEDAPNFSGTPNYDGSGDDVDNSIDIEGC